MLQVSEHRARPRIGRALGTVAAALLCATALGQPNLAYAGHGGDGGGGHSGGGVSTAADLVALRWLCGYAQWFR
jgi:hypothetical protein